MSITIVESLAARDNCWVVDISWILYRAFIKVFAKRTITIEALQMFIFSIHNKKLYYHIKYDYMYII